MGGKQSNLGRKWPYIKKKSPVTTFGVKGVGRGEFRVNRGITIDEEQRLYVVDRNNQRIQIFTDEGEYVTEIHPNFNTNYPNDIAVGDGCIFVSSVPNLIYTFQATTTNNLIKTYLWEIKTPRGLTVDTNGELYVADTYANRVVVLNLELECIRKIGEGSLDRPTDVKILMDIIFVADNNTSNTIHLFSKLGDLVNSFLNIKTNPIIQDTYICFDLEYNLIVCSVFNASIMVLSSEGVLIHKIKLEDSPRGIAVTDNFRIICSNNQNSIVIF
ncbi:NHL repeat containing protein [Oopsacas minuta]|uniref:NHL repeat containing protein n=1 Tax=Oopsacas minuta TaxID=111878 RepID=A0AAV7KB49_9METZ|nr:NHL repeat containing protein [Oopsacas minuta]